MTSENRLTIEPSDVTLIEFVCKDCGATLGRDPSNEKHFIPTECRNCNSHWLTPDSPLHAGIRGIVHGIRTVNQMANESRVSLRLHVKRDSETGPVTAKSA